MKLFNTEAGEIVITGDESLLTKVEGENLDGINVDGIHITVAELVKLFDISSARKTVESIGRYKFLKEKYFAAFSN